MAGQPDLASLVVVNDIFRSNWVTPPVRGEVPLPSHARPSRARTICSRAALPGRSSARWRDWRRCQFVSLRVEWRRRLAHACALSSLTSTSSSSQCVRKAWSSDSSCPDFASDAGQLVLEPADVLTSVGELHFEILLPSQRAGQFVVAG